MPHRWEALSDGWEIEVSDDFGFGADALHLARFSVPRAGERAVDLGTGCGILPLLWCRARPDLQVTALEIQPAAAAMARRSAARCGVSDRMTVLDADLRRWRMAMPPESQTLAAMNPPYFLPGSGKVSESPAARIARHETADPDRPGCTLADAAHAAAGLLRRGGRFCLCHRPERLCDLLETLRAAELEPKRLVWVCARRNAAPWLVLCEAVRGARPGLRIEAPYIETDAGQKENTAEFSL